MVPPILFFHFTRPCGAVACAVASRRPSALSARSHPCRRWGPPWCSVPMSSCTTAGNRPDWADRPGRGRRVRVL